MEEKDQRELQYYRSKSHNQEIVDRIHDALAAIIAEHIGIELFRVVLLTQGDPWKLLKTIPVQYTDEFLASVKSELDKLEHEPCSASEAPVRDVDVAESRALFIKNVSGNIESNREWRCKMQDNCNHLKENGESRVFGQRLSNGSDFYICAYCFKEWDEKTIPLHLKTPDYMFGGMPL